MAERSECTIDGCDRPNVGRGWCAKHYQRWQKTGDPLLTRSALREERTCSIDGCERKHEALNLCTLHYHRLRAGHVPGAKRGSDLSPAQRFWAKVDKSDTCWLWTGATNGRYGIVSGPRYAHRISYETTHGPVPAGLEIDHLCSVTRCVRPDHLEAVTPQENKRRARERAA